MSLPDGYIEIFGSMADPDGQLWLDIGELCAEREGWHWDHPENDDLAEGLWCFGLGGACRLALTVVHGQIVLYDADSDDETRHSTINTIRRWLDAHEAEYLNLSPLQEELIDSVTPHLIEEWRQEQLGE